MKKNTRVMDIIAFAICLFIILLLNEYSVEVGEKVQIGLSLPIALIGLFFGFRAANPDIVRGERDD